MAVGLQQSIPLPRAAKRGGSSVGATLVAFLGSCHFGLLQTLELGGPVPAPCTRIRPYRLSVMGVEPIQAHPHGGRGPVNTSEHLPEKVHSLNTTRGAPQPFWGAECS